MKPISKAPSRCLFFGGSGLLGSELWPLLEKSGYTVLAPSSHEVDCRDPAAVTECLRNYQPTDVIMAAARVGGILGNIRHSSEYLYDNAMMNLVTLRACAEQGIPRTLIFGSSCMYPCGIDRDIVEQDLLSGPLEETSEGYATGKIIATKYAQFLRREGRCEVTVCVLTNLYGDRDRFSEEGHLIASLIVKMRQAKQAGQPRVELWGDGTPRRDFLHASDAARACLAILKAQQPPEIVHVGTGSDITVREIADLVARAVGYPGEIVFSGAVSNGTFRKLLAVDWIGRQGWKPEVSLEEGLRRAYQVYVSKMETAGSVAR